MGSLRVLHIARLNIERVGGPTVSVPALVSAQNKTPGLKAALLNTTIKGIPPSGRDYDTFLYRSMNDERQIRRILSGFDLVVVHGTYIPANLRLAKWAHELGVPYIITPRGGMTRGAQRMKRWKKLVANILVFNRFVRNSMAIHCLTEDEAAETAYWRKRIFVVGNGVELPEPGFVASPGSGTALRVVYVGRLSPWHKGLDALVGAVAKVRDDLENAGVTIDLYGPDEEGSRRYLQQLIHRHNVDQLVKIHDTVTGDEKRNVLRDADAFVLTSRFEGHPMALLEALAHGLPSLVTPGTNMSNVIRQAGAGWTVDCDVESIAAGLLQIVRDRSRLAAMGQAARELARQYSWNNVASNLRKIYESLLNGKGRSSFS